MTNEKTIKAAAEEFADSAPKFMVSDAEDAAKAFKTGINWFRETIWHSDEEIPREDGFIIVWCGNRCEAIHTDVIRELGRNRKKGWNTFCVCFGIGLKWCYLADILPQKREEVRL